MANRLANETSPYLLQHAENPVDWHPWGEEALSAARAQDRPIFLSIGYSACHWCHVMEHESFENAEIAEVMNRDFINIKVDREERPDLDAIYMQSVVALTGQGGWPMSVFLTPEGRPFFGGTYWPPAPRYGRAGFPQILEAVKDAWDNRREQLDDQAAQLTQALTEEAEKSGQARPLSKELLARAGSILLRHADHTNGGFGHAPKFPHPFDLRVLLRVWKRFGDQAALEHVTLTLDKMARGGIYDHLGRGFHRYSTDAVWLAPHFEKMLYDNALLVPAYLEAFQATGHERFAGIARDTLDYVLDEMTQPEGGFYSTQDADSEGEEGKFFVWSADEIESILGSERAKIFATSYDVKPGGNWEGKTILNLPRPLEESADLLGMEATELEKLLADCRAELFEVRQKRIAPGRDDKILVSWNGMMIAAMAMASQVLGEDKYAQAAERAVDFILNSMRDDEGHLLHSFKDGRARFNGYLDDYACLIEGLVELYQATFDPRFLESGLELAETMTSRFAVGDESGFFYTAADHEKLIVRQKDWQDNATPSGNGMAATALLKLARITASGDLEQRAVDTLESLSERMHNAPSATGQSLLALDFLLGPTFEIVIAVGEDANDSDTFSKEVQSRFLPNKVLLRRPKEFGDDNLPRATETLLAGKTAQSGQAAVFLCEHGVCKAPLTDLSDLQATLDQLQK